MDCLHVDDDDIFHKICTFSDFVTQVMDTVQFVEPTND